MKVIIGCWCRVNCLAQPHSDLTYMLSIHINIHRFSRPWVNFIHTHTHTHRSHGPVEWLLPFTWQGVGLNPAQVAKDFSLPKSSYCPLWARGCGWCVMCEVSALSLHPSLWALTFFREGNGCQSWVQCVIIQTMVNNIHTFLAMCKQYLLFYPFLPSFPCSFLCSSSRPWLARHGHVDNITTVSAEFVCQTLYACVDRT